MTDVLICRIILEAFSTFSVNSDGHISSHKVDKVYTCMCITWHCVVGGMVY